MEIWVNMIAIDYPPSEVKQFIKAIEWYGGLGMNIPPQTHTTLQGGGASCTPPANLRILGVTGHVHASTTRFAMSMQKTGDLAPTKIFEDYNWEGPTVSLFH